MPPIKKAYGRHWYDESSVARRRALAALGGALATPMIASGIARAQADWPNKSVRYINLFPAGATTDVLSRIVCQELSELTGQQFMVENKGGSGGNVGADAIAKSAPDGYTVGLYSIASHAISPTLYARLPFDAEKDFTPDQHAVVGAQHLRHQARPAGEHGAGAGRPGEGQSRQVLLRLRRIGHQPASLRRDAEAARRPRHAACALSRRCAGDAGHARGSARHDVRQHLHAAGPVQGGQGEGARRHVARTSSRRTGAAGHVGVLSRLQHHLMGRPVRPGRPAAGHGREGRGADQEGAGQREPEEDVRPAGARRRCG